METSEVRKRILQVIDRAKRSAAERRAGNDAAVRVYEGFLKDIAVPIFRQVADALKASGYNFTVFTPGGSVRLMSDKAAEDYIELSLDTTGSRPFVVGRTSRVRGSRGVESERPIAEKTVDALTDGDVLEFMVGELAPFVER